MTTEKNNNTSLTLKRIGIFLKEKGINVKPLPESADVVETIQVDKTNLINTCKLLKEDKDMRFDLLISVSGVDKPKENIIESVYHLFSTEYHHKLVIKVELQRDNPKVQSVTPIWQTADWHERETYDLMGIHFEGHTNLNRILNPSDWIGHPLRKDYVLDDERLVWNER